MTSPDCVSAGLGIDVIEADEPCFDKWMPIATAPKATTILGFTRNGSGEPVIYVGRNYGEWFTPHPIGPYAPRYSGFTHWMPLPNFPRAAGGQGA